MTIFGIGLLLVASGGFSLGLILLVKAIWGIKWYWCMSLFLISHTPGSHFRRLGFFLLGVRRHGDPESLL